MEDGFAKCVATRKNCQQCSVHKTKRKHRWSTLFTSMKRGGHCPVNQIQWREMSTVLPIQSHEERWAPVLSIKSHEERWVLSCQTHEERWALSCQSNPMERDEPCPANQIPWKEMNTVLSIKAYEVPVSIWLSLVFRLNHNIIISAKDKWVVAEPCKIFSIWDLQWDFQICPELHDCFTLKYWKKFFRFFWHRLLF